MALMIFRMIINRIIASIICSISLTPFHTGMG